MQDGTEPLYGLTSAEALQRLHDELLAEIRLYEGKTKFSSLLERFRNNFLHHACVESVLHWTSCLLIVLVVLALFIAYAAQMHK